MKRGFNILLILIAASFIFSCSNNKSYTDMLKDERKAINRFFDAQGFEVLKNFPENWDFKENEFVQLESGVYLNIIDSGNGNRPTLGKTNILCRFKGQSLMGDTITFDYFSGMQQPLEFKYGVYTGSDYYFLSQGLGGVLDYVGDSAIVRLIVPFRVGSSYQSSSGIPLYYERVRYIFEK